MDTLDTALETVKEEKGPWIPMSVCSTPCPVGQIMIMNEVGHEPLKELDGTITIPAIYSNPRC